MTINHKKIMMWFGIILFGIVIVWVDAAMCHYADLHDWHEAYFNAIEGTTIFLVLIAVFVAILYTLFKEEE